MPKQKISDKKVYYYELGMMKQRRTVFANATVGYTPDGGTSCQFEYVIFQSTPHWDVVQGDFDDETLQ